MRPLLFILSIALFAISCKKDKTQTLNEEFVKGEVVVGVQDDVPLEQLFAYVNPHNLSIDEISGFYYTTNIPKDSIPYIKGVLNAKPYINTRGFSASVWPHYQTDIVHNATILWDMNLTNQQDYIQTKNFLRMVDMQSSSKYILLKVPEGQEIYWRDRFKTLPWVKWTELNQVFRGVLLH